MQKPDFSKGENGLLPAVIQDAVTGKVFSPLMLGYMNEEAVEKTKSTGKVTFYRQI